MKALTDDTQINIFIWLIFIMIVLGLVFVEYMEVKTEVLVYSGKIVKTEVRNWIFKHTQITMDNGAVFQIKGTIETKTGYVDIYKNCGDGQFVRAYAY